ncbi:Transcriptional activator NFYC/HAP5 subunit [Cryptosporidium meleagridis]
MDYLLQNNKEIVDYNVDGILTTQFEPQYNGVETKIQVDLSSNCKNNSYKPGGNIAISEFVGSHQLNQTSLSSFTLNSASYMAPSSRSTSSSSNSVISSSSLVSNSSICSREDINIISKDYITNENQSNIPVFSKDELKTLSRCLPHTKIKKIIKCSGAVNHMIGSEVPALLAIACELFVRDLTSFSWNFTKRARRRTVQVQDIKSVSSKDFRLKRLLHASKNQLKNFSCENESLGQNKKPILNYYSGGIYPQSMQIPISNIQSTQIYPKHLNKSQNNQQNIVNKQSINRHINNYNVNQEFQKSYNLSPDQHIQQNTIQLNNNNNHFYNGYYHY